MHPKEYGSLRAALLWQYSQFGSVIALRKCSTANGVLPNRCESLLMSYTTWLDRLRYAKSFVTGEGNIYSHTDGQFHSAPVVY